MVLRLIPRRHHPEFALFAVLLYRTMLLKRFTNVITNWFTIITIIALLNMTRHYECIYEGFMQADVVLKRVSK